MRILRAARARSGPDGGPAVGAAIHHRAQQARADRHQAARGARAARLLARRARRSLTVPPREDPFHQRRRHRGVGQREREHRRSLADAEGAQPRLQLLGVQAPRERLGEHVPGHAALQQLVALVEQLREHALGDRDERQLVGHLEQRERALARLVAQRRRELLVGEARAEAEPRDLVL